MLLNISHKGKADSDARDPFYLNLKSSNSFCLPLLLVAFCWLLQKRGAIGAEICLMLKNINEKGKFSHRNQHRSVFVKLMG